MGRSGIRLGVACFLLAASAIAAGAVDRNVRIYNETGTTIYRFYSTNSGASKWGSDVMCNSTLAPGASMRLNFDNKNGYCEFDFLAEFSDGST
jgi:hypothetical protein